MLQLEAMRRDSETRTESAQIRDTRIALAALGLAVVIGLIQIWVGWQQVDESRKATAAAERVALPAPTASAPTPSQPQLVPPTVGQP